MTTTTTTAAARRVYGTTEIARICRVAPRTVVKWLDSGKLEGYRLPPGPAEPQQNGAYRRCTREQLERFLRASGMPVPEEWGREEEEKAAAVTEEQAEPSPAPERQQPQPRPRREGRTNKTRRQGRVLTTGDVARLFTVAPRTVSKWADSGRLKCWRVPGSQDRRFEAIDVARMLREVGLPVPAHLPSPEPPVLLAVGTSPPPPCPEGWDVRSVPTLFAAGMQAHGCKAALFDLAVGRSQCLEAALALLASCEARGVPCPTLLCLVCEDESSPDELAEAFDHVLAPGQELAPLLTERAP